MDNGLKWGGVIGSVLYGTAVGLYVWLDWPDVEMLRPNEWGDFFAGLFSPLAFLWLVLGFFQQGKELRQNNEALKLQAKELQASVGQQTAMVDVQSRELKHYERSIEPLLKLEFVGFTQYDGDDFYKIRMANLGEYCEKVVVEVVGRDSQYSINNETLFAGDEFVFLVNSYGDEERFNIKVSYINRCGTSGHQNFTVQAGVDEDGPGVWVRKKAFLS